LSGGRPRGEGAWESRHPRVRALVLGRIADGTLGPGAVASIAELGPAAGVSRKTAAKALVALVAEGLLEHRRGVGYVVAEAPQPG
jgi:DNA-binding GntR family transcriptional regulator